MRTIIQKPNITIHIGRRNPSSYRYGCHHSRALLLRVREVVVRMKTAPTHSQGAASLEVWPC